MTSWGALLLVAFAALGLGRKRSALRVHTLAAAITIVVLIGVAVRQHTL